MLSSLAQAHHEYRTNVIQAAARPPPSHPPGTCGHAEEQMRSFIAAETPKWKRLTNTWKANLILTPKLSIMICANEELSRTATAGSSRDLSLVDAQARAARQTQVTVVEQGSDSTTAWILSLAKNNGLTAWEDPFKDDNDPFEAHRASHQRKPYNPPYTPL